MATLLSFVLCQSIFVWPWETIKGIWWDSKDSKRNGKNQCSNHLEPQFFHFYFQLARYQKAEFRPNFKVPLKACTYKTSVVLLALHTSTIIKLENLEGRKLILLQIFIFCYCCLIVVHFFPYQGDEMKTRTRVVNSSRENKSISLISLSALCASESKKKDWGVADERRRQKSSWIISLTTFNAAHGRRREQSQHYSGHPRASEKKNVGTTLKKSDCGFLSSVTA